MCPTEATKLLRRATARMPATIRIMAMAAVVFPRHRARAKRTRALTTTTRIAVTVKKEPKRHSVDHPPGRKVQSANLQIMEGQNHIDAGLSKALHMDHCRSA